MKKILILGLILLISFALISCDNEPEPGNLELAEINTAIKSYDAPYFEGKVENTGDITIYNSKITFIIYETENKENIIDTASGFPASGENIKPGQTANFEAVFDSDLSEDDLKHYDYKITFLER